MMTAKALKMAVLAAGFALAACESVVEVPEYADITFAHLPPINLNVQAVEARSTWRAPLDANHVEDELPVDLAETAMRWGRDRLQAVGTTGTATLTVLEASMVETKLEKQTGLTGLVTTDQDYRYDAVMTVMISAEDPNAQASAETKVTVNRSQTVPEDLTYNERERVWYQMSEKLMADLNERLEKAINTHMVYFLTP